MPEAAMTDKTTGDGNDLFRHPISTLQARIDALELEARGRLRRAIGASNDALHGLDQALARVSREDWSPRAMRRRIDGLRTRAEVLRVNALKRVADMPGSAVSALATGSRVPVQNLARELEKLAKRLEPGEIGEQPAQQASAQ